LIGNVLDKYEVLQKIGEGGMATVYRGRHVTLGRDVAIKVLHPHLSASEKNRQRFAREARAIEHLDHDNILKIFDYSGTEAADCYIVTEFVDGDTLQDVVQTRARLPSEVAALVGMKLSRALEYAHELGIIHRDLKLENVMLRGDGTVKLMDFGIARFLDEMNLTITGALVGSPAYMSPEQAMERVLDARSDLFSLGTLLFHLVTGQMPFTGGNPSIILRNIIEGNRPGVLELAPDMSGSFADLIERLMQTDPSDRIQTAGEVATLLQACLQEVGIDPLRPQWSLESWLLDPEPYDAQLKAHLDTHLLDLGKSRLSKRDHLGALRLFNRLLSIDDDNQEVLELVQSMHGGKTDEKGYRRLSIMGAALLAAVGIFYYVNQPNPPPSVAPNAARFDGGADPGIKAKGATEEDDAPPRVVATGATQRSTDADGAERSDEPTEVQREDDRSDREDLERRAGREGADQPDPPASLLVTVPGSWGDIYIDGGLRGRTGSVGLISLTPGTHTLEIRNDHALPYRRKFSVAPGESKTIEVTSLQRKPARIRLTGASSGDCTVVVDGVKRGTIAGMSSIINIREPDKAHELSVQCPDGTSHNRKLEPVSPGALVSVSLKAP